MSPIVVLLLSWPLMRIRPSGVALAAGGAGVAGVALMVLRPDATVDAVGVGAALAGADVFATGTTLTKRWGRPVPLLAFTSWQLIAGGLFLLPLAWVVEGPPPALTAVNMAGYAYLTLFSTAIAYSVWFAAFDRLSAGQRTAQRDAARQMAVAAGRAAPAAAGPLAAR